MQTQAFLETDPAIASSHRSEPEVPAASPFQGLLIAILRGMPWILLAAAVCGSAAYWYARRIPRLYTATAVIEITSSSPEQLSLGGAADRDTKDPDTRETIVKKFSHRSLLTRVATALDLPEDAAFVGPSTERPAPMEGVINMLAGQSKAEIQTGTRLVNVSFTHTNPAVAQRVANALVKEFLDQDADDHLSTLENQHSVLKATAEDLRNQVRASEQKMQDYKEEKNSVSLEDRYNLIEEKLKALNAELATARSERLGLESDRSSCKAVGSDTDKLFTIPSVSQDPEVQKASEKWTTQQTELAALSERYRSKYPRMIEARAQSEVSRQTLVVAIQSAPARIDALCQRAADKEQRLREAVAEQEGDLLKLESLMIPYRALQREYDADRALYAEVLKKLNESTVALEGKPAIFRVRDPAILGYPLPYRGRLYIIAGTFGGAFLTLGLIAALFFMDSSVKTVDEAECLLGLPVLADIPLSKRLKKNGRSLPLLDRPGSAIAESFRTLRTSLSLFTSSGKKVLLFTSAVSSEGKSVIVVNTAVAFAQQKLRTLVIDADLRQPSVENLLCTGRGETAGLAEYLLGGPLNLLPTRIPELHVLTAGKNLSNPAELLALPRLTELLEHVRESYDRILIDTAPVNLVSDTFNIVGHADAVCLAVRSYSTSRRVVERAIQLLGRVHVRPVGIILSHLPSLFDFGNYHSYSAKSMYGSGKTYATSQTVALAGARGGSAASTPRDAENNK